jgi:hypothetical protein
MSRQLCGECGAPTREKLPTASQLLSLGMGPRRVCTVDPKHGDAPRLFPRPETSHA